MLTSHCVACRYTVAVITKYWISSLGKCCRSK